VPIESLETRDELSVDEQVTIRHRRAGLVPGLVLVLTGAVVLLDHMGLISSERLWKFWPVALMVLGVAKLMEPCNRVAGAVMTLVGALFLLNNLGYTRLSWWDIWPIALICAGLMLIWNRFEMPKLPPLAERHQRVCLIWRSGAPRHRRQLYRRHRERNLRRSRTGLPVCGHRRRASCPLRRGDLRRNRSNRSGSLDRRL